MALDKAYTLCSNKLDLTTVYETGTLTGRLQKCKKKIIYSNKHWPKFKKKKRVTLYFQEEWKPLFNKSPLVIEMCQKSCPLFWSAIVLALKCKNNKQLTF